MSEETFEGNHPGPEWLSAWHDGELQDSAAAAVRKHLDACAECRDVLEQFRRLDEAVCLGDDARPEPADWEGIERRLRLRLEDELGLGIPMGAPRRYVESDAELVLLPTPQELQAGRAPRPFRLRWAVATAAGLTVALLTLRMISDRDWTVGTVINPVADRGKDVAAVEPVRDAPPVGPSERSDAKQASSAAAETEPVLRGAPGAGLPVAELPAQVPAEAGLASDASTLGKLEAMPAPREYLAEVDLATRQEAAPVSDERAAAAPSSEEARSDGDRSRSAMTYKSNAAETSSATTTTDPDYAMVFAAASRAREAGFQALARRGFELVRTGIPEDDLAREAEYEEILAGARMEIGAGAAPETVSERLESDAAASWAAMAPAEKLTCRKALAALRAAMTMANELGRPSSPEDADARLTQLRSCAS